MIWYPMIESLFISSHSFFCSSMRYVLLTPFSLLLIGFFMITSSSCPVKGWWKCQILYELAFGFFAILKYVKYNLLRCWTDDPLDHPSCKSFLRFSWLLSASSFWCHIVVSLFFICHDFVLVLAYMFSEHCCILGLIFLFVNIFLRFEVKGG
jgi:hypothetical protein